MPESVRETYRKNLLSDELARSYMFEIEIAWVQYSQGLALQWYENVPGRHAEFKAQNSEIEFEVECKWISLDQGRKMSREDFLRLADGIMVPLWNEGLTGIVEVIVPDRLPSSQKEVERLSELILDQCILGGTGQIETEGNAINFRLAQRMNRSFEKDKLLKQLVDYNPLSSISVISARRHGNKAVDPILFVCGSRRPDNVVRIMEDKLRDAAKNQLCGSIPGVVCCYLPEIEDFEVLRNGSELDRIASNMFTNPDYSHVAALIFSSGRRIVSDHDFDVETFPFLQIRSMHCRFENIRGRDFMDRVKVVE